MASDHPTDQIFAHPDVIAILDRLTEMVHDGKSLPMSSSVMVNRSEALELLDRARATLPDDVVAAEGIINQATDVLDQADREAADTRLDAEEYSKSTRAEAEEFATSTREHAQAEAQRIVDQAHEQAHKQPLPEAQARRAAPVQAARDLLDGLEALADDGGALHRKFLVAQVIHGALGLRVGAVGRHADAGALIGNQGGAGIGLGHGVTSFGPA